MDAKRLEEIRARHEQAAPNENFDIFTRLGDYAVERENIRWHEFADEHGEDEEDCCDGDVGAHIVEAGEIEADIVGRFDAMGHALAAARGDVATLLAALGEARAQLRVLARYVAHEADATGETLPDLTNGEAREAIDLARELVEADDNDT